MKGNKIPPLEYIMSQGFKEVMAELEQDDLVENRQESYDLEERLKQRKEVSASHKRIEDIRKITRNK